MKIGQQHPGNGWCHREATGEEAHVWSLLWLPEAKDLAAVREYQQHPRRPGRGPVEFPHPAEPLLLRLLTLWL